MIEAANLDIDINLKKFSDHLQRLGLSHRITEESGRQILWVQSEPEAHLLREALNQWLEEDHTQQKPIQQPASKSVTRSPVKHWINSVWHAVYLSPTTLISIIICLAVAVASQLGNNTATVRELFYPLLPDTGILELLASINSPLVFLNTLTPMFLHFGELHLIFNMLWLWYFGKQLESLQSRWLFLGLIISTAFISNTAQYLALGFNNFGGMSGVVYGLVGYAWVIHFFMPRSHLLINNGMFVVFVIALIAMEIFASSLIATVAHATGLITGLLLGFLVVLVYRFVLRRQVIGYNRPR